MINLDLKTRFRNKTFLIALVSAIVLLIQQLGFKNLIPANYSDIVNSVLTILTMLGIVIDPTSIGICDTTTISNSTKNTVSTDSTNTKTSVSDSSNSTDLNASAKIVVENPDNTQTIGATVNAVSANKPQ